MLVAFTASHAARAGMVLVSPPRGIHLTVGKSSPARTRHKQPAASPISPSNSTVRAAQEWNCWDKETGQSKLTLAQHCSRG